MTPLVHITVTVAATPAELELRRLFVLGADHDFLQDREHFVEGVVVAGKCVAEFGAVDRGVDQFG